MSDTPNLHARLITRDWPCSTIETIARHLRVKP